MIYSVGHSVNIVKVKWETLSRSRSCSSTSQRMSRSSDTSAVLHTNFIGSVTTVEILCLAMEFYILISLHAFIWNNTINKFTRLPLSEDNTYLMEYINENDIVLAT